jgi:hypothetical protein
MPDTYKPGQRGRKRASRGKEDPRSPLMLWVPTRTLDQFKTTCHSHGVSMSEVLTDAIARFLEEYQ